MNNDKKIMQLTALVEEKRASLGTCPKFTPKTTCMLKTSLSIDTNINTFTSVNDTNNALFLLGLYQVAAEKVGMTDEEVTINGFTLADWISDVKAKKLQLLHKEKEKELTSIEKQLDAMLSDDKKTELKLDAIEKLLS